MAEPDFTKQIDLRLDNSKTKAQITAPIANAENKLMTPSDAGNRDELYWIDADGNQHQLNTTAQVATNTANIATNVGDISTNTADIATNAGDIATNTSDISDNAADIVALQNEQILLTATTSTESATSDSAIMKLVGGADYILEDEAIHAFRFKITGGLQTTTTGQCVYTGEIQIAIDSGETIKSVDGWMYNPVNNAAVTVSEPVIDVDVSTRELQITVEHDSPFAASISMDWNCTLEKTTTGSTLIAS